jgi:hypothetical protein
VTSAVDKADPPQPSSEPPEGPLIHGSTATSGSRHLVSSLLSLGPFALALTVYGLLLDHLQDDWFKYEWLKYALSGLAALCVGMATRLLGMWLLAPPDPVPVSIEPAVPQLPLPMANSGVLSIHTKLTKCATVIAADLRTVDQVGERIFGWSQYIGEDVPPTAIGTSYGLRIALALDVRHAAIDRYAIVQSVLAMQKPGGGWAASTQKDVARPGVTALVLAALCRCGLEPQTKDGLVTLFHQMARADPLVWSRTTVAVGVLSSMTEVQPGSPLVRDLADVLVNGASRDTSEDKPLASWGESLTGYRRESPAHTARAVIALTRAAAALQGDQALLEIRDAGIDWLCRQQVSLDPLDEQIRRPVSAGNADAIFVGHFTASWVARAIMCGDLTADRLPFVAASVSRVMRSQEGGIWRWQDGAKPIWMSYQGIVTLREYGLRGLKWPP